MIEEKLDGERIQIHKCGDQFRYFSRSVRLSAVRLVTRQLKLPALFSLGRKNKDYTYLYGKDRTEGSLTPHIADCFREGVADCILE